MKKTISILLVLFIVLVLFAGCKKEKATNHQSIDVDDEDTTQYDESGIPNPGEPSTASGGVSEKNTVRHTDIRLSFTFEHWVKKVTEYAAKYGIK